MKRLTKESQIRQAIEAEYDRTGGIFRLAPCWVGRPGTIIPGRRIPPCIKSIENYAVLPDGTRHRAYFNLASFYGWIGMHPDEAQERIREVDSRHPIRDPHYIARVAGYRHDHPGFVGCQDPVLIRYCDPLTCFRDKLNPQQKSLCTGAQGQSLRAFRPAIANTERIPVRSVVADARILDTAGFPMAGDGNTNPDSRQPRVFWMHEAIQYLRLDHLGLVRPEKAIYRLVRKGALHPRKINGHFIFERRELDRLLAQGDQKRGRGRPRKYPSA